MQMNRAAPMTLNSRCTVAVRFAVRLVPMQESTAVTQVPMFCPKDDEDRGFNGHDSLPGQCHQHAHRSRGALDDSGEHQTDENAQQRVGEGGHHVLEHLGLAEGSQCIAHVGHTHKQDTESRR